MKKIAFIALALILLGGLAFIIVKKSGKVDGINEGKAEANTELPKTDFSYETDTEGLVVLPDNITEIEPHAFEDAHIKRVILPKGLKKIGEEAFYNSDIEEIEIPGSVDSIGRAAFKSCRKLHKLILNEGLVAIGDEAFESCDTLTAPFTLPSTVKSIGDFAFGYAPGMEVPIEWIYEHNIARNIIIPENSKLESVGCDGLPYAEKLFVPKSLKKADGLGHPFFTAPKEHPLFCSIDGVLYSKDTTVLIRFPKEKGGIFIMPNSVRKIDSFAFEYNTVLEKIVLSNHLESIKMNPLTSLYSNLKKVEISGNSKFKTIDSVLFSHDLSVLIYYPQGLKKDVYIVPKQVKHINERAFQMAQTKKIVLPSGLQSVEREAFYEPRNIQCIEFTGGRCNIGSSAFEVFQDGQNIDSIIFRPKISDEESDKDDSKEIDARSCREMSESLGNTNGVKYVDLGLPSGNLWAETNLDETDIHYFGRAYAWGETSAKENASYENYKYAKAGKGEKGFTKYVLDGAYGNNGFVDNKATLELSDDAVHNALGGSWRIPTECDWQELLDNCTLSEVIIQGHYRGLLLRGKKGKTLYLPTDEYSSENEVPVDPEVDDLPDVCHYASSSISLSDQSYARVLSINYYSNVMSNTIRMNNYPRYEVSLLRPVCPVKK